jgi:hypothetical protein
MKHILFFAMMALELCALMAAPININLSQSTDSAELISNRQDGLSMRFNLSSLTVDEIENKQGRWTVISQPDFGSTKLVGLPKLPLLRKIISVPFFATPVLTLSEVQMQDVSLLDYGFESAILPQQESLSKSADPDFAPFSFDQEFYSGNLPTQQETIRISELGILRSERLFCVDFLPVTYNPSTRKLQLVTSVKVDLSFEGADDAATQAYKEKTYSPAFENLYSSNIWNHQPERHVLLRYPLGYVIITPEDYLPALQDFIAWKRNQGFILTIATTEEIGASNTQIKDFMQNVWDQATVENPAPSYLLLVGDVDQMPTHSGTTSLHPTDLPYVRLEGTDFMPEMYVGRLSVANSTQLTNQVNKSLMYQQYTWPDDSHLQRTVLISGVDPSYAMSHCNGQINYAHEEYMNAGNGFDSNVYLYPESGTAASQIIADVSAGAGWVNYTAHGSVNSWVNPSFTISDINSLQNYDQAAMVVGNCCLSHKYDEDLSFSEAWLRAENKGAAVYIGGSNSTYWDEDYWWAVGAKGPATGEAPPYNIHTMGSYDSMFHEHNEPFEMWAASAGEMVVAGNLAVVQSNSFRVNYYWEIYSVLGDPSAMPYTGIPAENSLQVPDTLPVGIDRLELNADPYSYVAISKDNVLHGVAMADANGYLQLEFDAFESEGTAQIVATRSNRRPFVAELSIEEASSAYVVVTAMSVSNEELPHPGNSFSVDLQLENLGAVPVQNLTAFVLPESPWLGENGSVIPIGDIAAHGSLTVNGVFDFVIHPSALDQHLASLIFSVGNDDDQWHTRRSLVITAPQINLSESQISDENQNGIFESEENLQVTLSLQNDGHYAAPSGSLLPIINHNDISSLDDYYAVPALAIGESYELIMNLQLAPNLSEGTLIPVGLAINLDGQMFNHNLIIPIGAIDENFESGDFATFDWVNDSPSPWEIDSSDPQSGSYAAKSGDISHNEISALEITRSISWDSEISFWRKVSSEPGVDLLKFFIDDVEMGSWGGVSAWEMESYPVQAGTRTFRWTYTKDYSISFGSDCAWIDEISFPLSGAGEIPVAYSEPDSLTFVNVLPNSYHRREFVLRNLGKSNLTGTISFPAHMNLESEGLNLPQDYAYELPWGQNQIFSLVLSSGSEVQNFEGTVQISTNDQYLALINIPVNVSAGVSSADDVSPWITALTGNFPNPFNPSTNISFSLQNPTWTRLAVYNLKGQLVKILADEYMPSGKHQLIWNGQDEHGRPVSSGIYLYRFQAENYCDSQKMILLK